MPSPSLIDSVGHSGTHAPQAMQSSVIFMAMVITPSKFCFYGFKINPCHETRQMTNIFYLVNFVTVLLFCQVLLQKQATFTRSSILDFEEGLDRFRARRGCHIWS